MDVEYGLSRIRPAVVYQPVAFGGDAQLFGNFLGSQENIRQYSGICGRQIVRRCNMRFGYDNDMDRGYRIYIPSLTVKI